MGQASSATPRQMPSRARSRCGAAAMAEDRPSNPGAAWVLGRIAVDHQHREPGIGQGDGDGAADETAADDGCVINTAHGPGFATRDRIVQSAPLTRRQMKASWPGPDPAIHVQHRPPSVDARVKHGHDDWSGPQSVVSSPSCPASVRGIHVVLDNPLNLTLSLRERVGVRGPKRRRVFR